ncbi:hypothetical protein CK203_038946 [Vitis vinifera]|uniref:Uncharacterized protein n=1 Tax=Vitis vinifera TaxID=29760 RepID=A0A438HG20_VITVI|nr:hypothetical protein CK203_038946 [Vitis vinifera]
MNPLSPYLFVVAMEVLSCLLKRAKDWYPLGVRHVEKLTFELGCNVGGLSSAYMGLSLGGKRSILNRSLVANMRKMEVSSLVVRGYETKLWKTIGKYWDTFYNRSSFVSFKRGLGNGLMKSNRLEGVVIDGEGEDKMVWMDSRRVFSKVKFSLGRVPENSKVKHIGDDRESVKILRLVVKLFAFKARLRVSSSQRVNQWYVGDEDAFFGNIQKLA